MKRFFNRIAFGFGALIFVALAGANARADVVYLGPVAVQPAGIGVVTSILSIQSPGSTSIASGAVRYVVNGNNRGDEVIGDAKGGAHSNTRTFSELGITNGSQLRIFVNVNDPDNDIVLTDLVVTAYDSRNGSILFQGFYRGGPLLLPEIGTSSGIGNSDHVFGLDAQQAAQLQAAFLLDPNLRIGLSGRTTDDTGGFTNFFGGNAPAAPVPEPATMLLFGTGIAGLAARARRRRKAQPK